MLLLSQSSSSLKGHKEMGEVSKDWKKSNVTTVFRRQHEEPRKLVASQPHLQPLKGGGTVHPGCHF